MVAVGDTFPAALPSREPGCGIITLVSMSITKLHNITHNEPLGGSHHVRKIVYVFITLSKMLFAAIISRSNNFPQTRGRSLEELGLNLVPEHLPWCFVLEPPWGRGLCIRECRQGWKCVWTSRCSVDVLEVAR